MGMMSEDEMGILLCLYSLALSWSDVRDTRDTCSDFYY